MKCASKQDEIISSSQNFLKGKNVNKAGKIPTLPKRRDCQQSVSRLICGLVHISERMLPQQRLLLLFCLYGFLLGGLCVCLTLNLP